MTWMTNFSEVLIQCLKKWKYSNWNLCHLLPLCHHTKEAADDIISHLLLSHVSLQVFGFIASFLMAVSLWTSYSMTFSDHQTGMSAYLYWFTDWWRDWFDDWRFHQKGQLKLSKLHCCFSSPLFLLHRVRLLIRHKLFPQIGLECVRALYSEPKGALLVWWVI